MSRSVLTKNNKLALRMQKLSLRRFSLILIMSIIRKIVTHAVYTNTIAACLEQKKQGRSVYLDEW